MPILDIVCKENDYVLLNAPDFSLVNILDCGQCFRFYPIEPQCSEYIETYEGVAMGHYLKLSRDNANNIIFHNTTKEDFLGIWKSYFDLDTDYAFVKRCIREDDVLARATDHAPGIRVLHQDGWEALCSFIISQNNNIKRIKGIVARFSEDFGTPIEDYPTHYSFPTPAQLAGITPDDLAPLRAGFRAKYLADAIEKVNSGEVNLELLSSLPLEEARENLMKIKGVGPKVADCALLYGFGRMECFPLDVWMKRVMANFYPDGLPECAKAYAGIAQQYLFHYARTSPEAFEGI